MIVVGLNRLSHFGRWLNSFSVEQEANINIGYKYILILMYVTITNKLPYLRPLERSDSSEGLKALVCGSSGPGFESS